MAELTSRPSSPTELPPLLDGFVVGLIPCHPDSTHTHTHTLFIWKWKENRSCTFVCLFIYLDRFVSSQPRTKARSRNSVLFPNCTCPFPIFYCLVGRLLFNELSGGQSAAVILSSTFPTDPVATPPSRFTLLYFPSLFLSLSPLPHFCCVFFFYTSW